LAHFIHLFFLFSAINYFSNFAHSGQSSFGAEHAPVVHLVQPSPLLILPHLLLPHTARMGNGLALKSPLAIRSAPPTDEKAAEFFFISIPFPPFKFMLNCLLNNIPLKIYQLARMSGKMV
jgi:hypothetical protein